MAYTFKKLTDVDSASQVSSGDNVFIKQDGDLKKVDASKVGTVVTANPEDLSSEATNLTGLRVSGSDFKIAPVEANPTEETTDELSAIKIDNTSYKIKGLPDGTTAGQALIYDGDKWVIQNDYDYCTVTTSTICPSQSLQISGSGSELKWLSHGSGDIPTWKISAILTAENVGSTCTVTLNGVEKELTIQKTSTQWSEYEDYPYSIGKYTTTPENEGDMCICVDMDGAYFMYASYESSLDTTFELEHSLKNYHQISSKYIYPSDTSAGDAIVYNGEDWEIQDDYGYTNTSGEEIYSTDSIEFTNDWSEGLRWFWTSEISDENVSNILDADHLNEICEITINGTTIKGKIYLDEWDDYTVGEYDNNTPSKEGLINIYKHKGDSCWGAGYTINSEDTSIYMPLKISYIKCTPIDSKYISRDGYGYETQGFVELDAETTITATEQSGDWYMCDLLESNQLPNLKSFLSWANVSYKLEINFDSYYEFCDIHASGNGTTTNFNIQPSSGRFYIYAKQIDSTLEITEYEIGTIISGSHQISINKEGTVVHKIASKYIPSDFPTAATAGDAMVYNGTEWAKQDGYGYTTSTKTAMQDEATATGFTTSGTVRNASLGTDFQDLFNFIYDTSNNEKTVTVIFDGVSYTTTAHLSGSQGGYIRDYIGEYADGNPVFTNLPFCILFSVNPPVSNDVTIYNTSCYVPTTDTAESHTIEVYEGEEVVHTINPKYISIDGYGYGTKEDIIINASENIGPFTTVDTTRSTNLYTNNQLTDLEAYFIPANANKTVYVRFDGTVYTTTLNYVSGSGTAYTLGDTTCTSYPFGIYAVINPRLNNQFDAYTCYVSTTDTEEYHTIEVLSQVSDIHKIDSKYLPQSIVYIDALSSLPSTGDSNALYIIKGTCEQYRWVSSGIKYKLNPDAMTKSAFNEMIYNFGIGESTKYIYKNSAISNSCITLYRYYNSNPTYFISINAGNSKSTYGMNYGNVNGEQTRYGSNNLSYSGCLEIVFDKENESTDLTEEQIQTLTDSGVITITTLTNTYVKLSEIPAMQPSDIGIYVNSTTNLTGSLLQNLKVGQNSYYIPYYNNVTQLKFKVTDVNTYVSASFISSTYIYNFSGLYSFLPNYTYPCTGLVSIISDASKDYYNVTNIEKLDNNIVRIYYSLNSSESDGYFDFTESDVISIEGKGIN